MLKLTGAVLIIAAGGVWGFSKSARLAHRKEVLESIISALTLLENEISYAKNGIKTALDTAGSTSSCEIFTAAAKKIDGSGLKAAFNEAVEQEGNSLLEEDKQQLKMLSDNLGTTDSATQIKSIRHIRELMKNALESAGTEYERSGKLYRNMGVLTAAAIVILLF